eukprot:m.268704 g.268704  ORF g.268704 m.268704 type:complete len:55 (-) comp74907_c0_seq1:235-399(-)
MRSILHPPSSILHVLPSSIHPPCISSIVHLSSMHPLLHDLIDNHHTSPYPVLHR